MSYGRYSLSEVVPLLQKLADVSPSSVQELRLRRLATEVERVAAAGGEAVDMETTIRAVFAGERGGDAAKLRNWRFRVAALADQYDIDLVIEVDGYKQRPPSDRECFFSRRRARDSHDPSAARRASELALVGAPVVESVPRGASRTAPGAEISVVRVVLDGPGGRVERPAKKVEAFRRALAAALVARLSIGHDASSVVEVEIIEALAGEDPEQRRAERLRAADVIVVLLSNEYLAKRTAVIGTTQPAVVGILWDECAPATGGSPVSGTSVFGAVVGSDDAPVGHRSAAGRPFAKAVEEAASAVLRAHDRARAAVHRAAERQLMGLNGEVNVVAGRAQRSRLVARTGPSSSAAIADIPCLDAHLFAWCCGERRQSFLAILGEYGIGKTTACIAVARQVLRARQTAPDGGELPVVFYFDLRDLTERRGELFGPGVSLERILDELLTRRRDRAGDSVSAPFGAVELLREVRDRAAVAIFDGLDEILVHLPAAQHRPLLEALWQVLPRDGDGIPGRGAVIITCRTHYFATLGEQNSELRAAQRGERGEADFEVLHLLPFGEAQIRAYLSQRLSGDRDRTEAGRDADRAIAFFRRVHDLRSLAERPYLLHLIAQQLEALETQLASGARVNAASLYEHIIDEWLERDAGKHRLAKEHKPRLMEDLAAYLWRLRTRVLSSQALRSWLERYVAGEGPVADSWRAQQIQAEPVSLDELVRDVRTSTFIVRPGDTEFQFAHTSMLEYFLARYLHRSLVEGHAATAWELPRPGRETLTFLGQIASNRADTAHEFRVGIDGLREPYRESVSELLVAYLICAGSQGLPGGALARLDLHGADLRGLQLGAWQGTPAKLVDCNLDDADLSGARFNDVLWKDGSARRANLSRAELVGGRLEGVDLQHANLTGFVACDVRVRAIDVSECRAHGTQWLRCTPEAPVDAAQAGGPGHIVAPRVSRATGRPARRPRGSSPRCFIGHIGEVSCLASAPNDGRIATGGGDGLVRLWDPSTGEQVVDALGDHIGRVSSVVFSLDGATLATGGQDETVRLWDPGTGASESRPLRGHPGGVWSLAFAPDGQVLAAGSGNGVLRLWSPSSGEPIGDPFDIYQGAVAPVAFSPDGAVLVVGTGDGRVLTLDPRTGKAIKAPLRGHSGGVWSVAFSPDGDVLAVGSAGGSVRLWDVAAADQITGPLTGHAGGVWSVAFSLDSGTLAAGGGNGVARLWDVATGEPKAEPLARHPHGGVSVAFIEGSGALASGGADGIVRLWDATTGQPAADPVVGRTGGVAPVAFSADGRLATGSTSGSVLICAPKSGELVHAPLGSHLGGVLSVSFSPDGSVLAAGSADGQLRLWNPSTGEQLAELGRGSAGGVLSVSFSPDGSVLAAGSADGLLRLWNPPNWSEASDLPTGRLAGGVSSVAFSPAGDLLATGTGFGRVTLRSPETGRQIRDPVRRPLTGEAVASLAFSRDGSVLAIGSEDGLVRLIDPLSGHEKFTSLPGHPGGVWSVAFSSTGDVIAVGTAGGLVRLWRVATSEQIATIGQFGSDAAWFTPDAISWATPGAWRWLGWVVPSRTRDQRVRYPADTFGVVAQLP